MYPRQGRNTTKPTNSTGPLQDVGSFSGGNDEYDNVGGAPPFLHMRSGPPPPGGRASSASSVRGGGGGAGVGTLGRGDINNEVCFSSFKGSAAICERTEGTYIHKALSELPELVRAFFLARKEYCQGPSAHLMDKVRLRIHYIDTIVQDILKNEEVVECLEPNHVIAPYCPVFVATWDRVGKFEEDSDNIGAGNGPSTELSTVASQIGAVASRLRIVDSSSLSWSAAATSWSTPVIISTIAIFISLIVSAAIGALTFFSVDKLPSYFAIIQVGLSVIAFTAMVIIVVSHKETLALLSNLQGRYREILGLAERYTRAASNLASSGQDKQSSNPLNGVINFPLTKPEVTVLASSPGTGLTMASTSASPRPNRLSIQDMIDSSDSGPPKEPLFLVAPSGGGGLSPMATTLPPATGSGSVSIPSNSSLVPTLMTTNPTGTGPMILNPQGPMGDGSQNPLPALADSSPRSTSMPLAGIGGLGPSASTSQPEFSPVIPMSASPNMSQSDRHNSMATIGGANYFPDNTFILGSDTYISSDMLQEELMIISLNHNLEVTAFNAQACNVTEFEEEEMKGISIATIVDDTSYDTIQEMLEQMMRGGRVESKKIEFFGKQGSTEVKVFVAPLRRVHDKRHIGCAILGLREVAPSKTNNVMLLRYYLDQVGTLMSEVSRRIDDLPIIPLPSPTSPSTKQLSLPPGAGNVQREGSVTSVSSKANSVYDGQSSVQLNPLCLVLLKRAFAYLGLVEWDNVCTVARTMLDWEAIRTDKLLLPTVRNFIDNMDLELSHPIPDVVECDVEAVNELLSLLLRHCKKRCLVVLSVGQYKPEICSLLRISVKSTDIDKEAVKEDPVHATYTGRSGSCISYEPNGDAFIDFPLQPSASLAAGHMSASNIDNSDHDGTLPSSPKAKTGPQFMFLLYEAQTIYRHSVSTSIWNLGHPLCIIDSADEASNIPRSNLTTIAILDYNAPQFIRVCNLLLAHSTELIVVIAMDHKSYETTGGKDEPTLKMHDKDCKKVKKPIRKRDLIRIIDQASHVATDKEKKKEEDEKEGRQANLLTAHHSSPWRRGALLGRGSFGSVYLADNILTGGKMAVKMIHLEHDAVEEQTPLLLNEVDIMCTVSHPHIVHYFYCEKGAATLNLFMELCVDGSLTNYLTNPDTKKPKHMTLNEAAAALKQILEATAYLHSIGIVHRDIKPDNILLNEGKMKIADFGTATKIGPKKLSDTSGTMKYMAPEIWEGLDYAYPCDIWSIGIVFLEMLGKQPYWLKNCTNFSLNSYYYGLGEDKNVDLPADLTGDALDFVRCCLQTKQVNRPTATTLVNFPFIVSYTSNKAMHNFSRTAVATSNDGNLIRRNSLRPAALHAQLGAQNSGSTRSLAKSSVAASSERRDSQMTDSGSDDLIDLGPPGGGGGASPGIGGGGGMPPGVGPPGFGGGGGMAPGMTPPGFGPPAGGGGGMPPGSGPPGFGGKPAKGGGMPPGSGPPGFGGGMPPGAGPPGFGDSDDDLIDLGPPGGGRGGAPPGGGGGMPPGVGPPGFGGGGGMPPGMAPPGVNPPSGKASPSSTTPPTKSSAPKQEAEMTGHEFDQSQDIGKMMKEMAAEKEAQEEADLEKDEEAEIKAMIKQAQRGAPAPMDDDEDRDQSWGSSGSDLIGMSEPLM